MNMIKVDDGKFVTFYFMAIGNPIVTVSYRIGLNDRIFLGVVTRVKNNHLVHQTMLHIDNHNLNDYINNETATNYGQLAVTLANANNRKTANKRLAREIINGFND